MNTSRIAGWRYIVLMTALCVGLLVAWLSFDATFARLPDPGPCGSTPGTAPAWCWQRYDR